MKQSDQKQTSEVALLTGCRDEHYAFGVATSLAAQGIRVDVIGNDEMDVPAFRNHPNLNLLNLRGNQHARAGVGEKILRIAKYYARLIRYAAGAKPRVFHILWNNKIEALDRTLLMLYYKLLGKRIAFTAHNVNVGQRDATDSAWNQWTLRVQYRLADVIFVHTLQMKDQLIEEFGVSPSAVTVIPYGLNNAVPVTKLAPTEARRQCGIGPNEKVILFFGEIAPYKGLDLLVNAFARLADSDPAYRLVIAGRPKGGSEKSRAYWSEIDQQIEQAPYRDQVTKRIAFVPDEQTEMYFKAADVLALPYRTIFQSGVLFLAFGFGLPVVASDVGAFRDDVIEGKTGFLCRPEDSEDLASTIRRFFDSELYAQLDRRRSDIQNYVATTHSWSVVAQIMHHAYDNRKGADSREIVRGRDPVRQ